jgi:hypothetical protein
VKLIPQALSITVYIVLSVLKVRYNHTFLGLILAYASKELVINSIKAPGTDCTEEPEDIVK